MSPAHPGHPFVLAVPVCQVPDLDQHSFHMSCGPSFASHQVRDVMNSANFCYWFPKAIRSLCSFYAMLITSCGGRECEQGKILKEVN